MHATAYSCFHGTKLIESQEQLPRSGTEALGAHQQLKDAPHRQRQKADQHVGLDPLDMREIRDAPQQGR